MSRLRVHVCVGAHTLNRCSQSHCRQWEYTSSQWCVLDSSESANTGPELFLLLWREHSSDDWKTTRPCCMMFLSELVCECVCVCASVLVQVALWLTGGSGEPCAFMECDSEGVRFAVFGQSHIWCVLLCCVRPVPLHLSLCPIYIYTHICVHIYSTCIHIHRWIDRFFNPASFLPAKCLPNQIPNKVSALHFTTRPRPDKQTKCQILPSHMPAAAAVFDFTISVQASLLETSVG